LLVGYICPFFILFYTSSKIRATPKYKIRVSACCKAAELWAMPTG
jgi:hypothetical protein